MSRRILKRGDSIIFGSADLPNLIAWSAAAILHSRNFRERDTKADDLADNMQVTLSFKDKFLGGSKSLKCQR